MNRRGYAALALVALAVLSGCSGGVDRGALSKDATYDYNRTATVTYDLTGGSYHAVVNVSETETDRLELYWRARIGGEQPVRVKALEFQYPNGTVVNASAFAVRQKGDRTIVEPPAARGTVAFSASNPEYEKLYVPVGPEGSYEVILPGGMRVAAPLLGRVSPGGYRTWIEDDRTHVYWASTPSGDVKINYYFERDFYIFAGIVGAGVLLAIGGVVFFRLQIRRLEARREQSDLDVGE